MVARGVHLLRLGQPGEAVQVLLAAVEAGAEDFEAYHALGTGLLQTGRFADASSVLEHAAELKPDSAAAFSDLGAAYDQQGMHEQAIAAYQRAVTLAPRLGDVLARLGQLYAMYSRNAEASASLERAADAKPKAPQARLYRSDAALLRGDMAGAEAWARKGVALAPGDASAHGGLAGTLYNQGRFDEAAASFEQALRLEPRVGKFWHGLAQCRKYAAEDGPILERMGAVLRRGDLHDGDRMVIHFASGKVLEDRGDYARAMEQFVAANALRGRGLAFDKAALAAVVDRAIATFTPEFFARHADAGVADEKPLFIVGMYRSGTTLVEQILSSHPQIAGGGELTVWGPTELEPAAEAGDFDAARIGASAAKYLAALGQIGPRAARVTDKLPPNLFRLGEIHTLMPRARIIHCRRDPIDTCLSIYTTNFGPRIPFAAQQSDLAFYYRQYLRMMAHWRAVLPSEVFLEVEYEQLVAEREAETRRLIAFAGVAWDESCLRPERNERAIGTASAWQARQPVYATSVQRWRRYEGWGQALHNALEGG
jgi:tetratricopeptide (TPR) repeat protein